MYMYILIWKIELAEQLKEDPTAEPPKVVSKTVQQTISKLFSSQRLEFENGKIWLDSLSQILNSDLVKALLDIPESYAQTLVNWFFKDRKPGEDYCGKSINGTANFIVILFLFWR